MSRWASVGAGGAACLLAGLALVAPVPGEAVEEARPDKPAVAHPLAQGEALDRTMPAVAHPSAQGEARPDKPAVAHPSSGPAAAHPLADPHRALLDSGWQELRYANWPKARDLLEQAIAESPKTEIKAEAMYALATLWHIRQPGGSYAEAQRLYARAAGEFPDTPAAPWALLALARLADMPEYEKDRNVDRARQLYREVLQRYADHAVADEATLRLAMTYLEKIGDKESEDAGAAMLLGRIAEKPKNYLVYAMHLVLGDLAQRRQEHRQAVAHWIAADPGIIGASDRAALYYKIGYTAEHNLKDYALAAQWYDRIVTDVKRENRYYIAKVAAERCRGLAAQAGQAAPAAPGAPASRGMAAPRPAKEGAP